MVYIVLKIVEDMVRMVKLVLVSECEEFEVWRRKAREIIDFKDREIDCICVCGDDK